MIDGTSIRCTCCNRQKKLAEIHMDEAGGSLQVVSRQHGTNHIAEISTTDILESAAGTVGMEGIHAFISNLYGERSS